MKIGLLSLLLILSLSCVKEEGKIASSSSDDGSSDGGTTGTPTVPVRGKEDPLAAQAWHLENTGQKSFSATAGLIGEDIKVKSVHAQDIVGRGIRIAVSDTGLDFAHPDITNNTLSREHRNYNFSDPRRWKEANPYPTDNDAHGTAVSGLIAAEGWNGIGSRGVAPSANIAAFRYIYDDPAATEESMLARQLDQMYGDFDIFNYSYGRDGRGFFTHDDSVDEALLLGITELRNLKGAIYVQAAGNDFKATYSTSLCPSCPPHTFNISGNTNSDTEMNTPYKVIVGATNALGKKSSYSTPGSGIWVSAPGGEYGYNEPAMITTDIQDCLAGYSFSDPAYSLYFNFGSHPNNKGCNYTNTMNGTSSATPVTAGVVALILQANPDLSWRDVKHILAMTSDKIDFDPLTNTLPHPYGVVLPGHVYDEKWIMNAAGLLYSNWYGFGRVNAKNAVEMAKTYDLNTMGEYEQTLMANGSWLYDSGMLAGKLIPETSADGVEDKIWVGHNFVIENIQIKLNTDHPFPGELGIQLTSPYGTVSRILPVNSNIVADGLEPDFQFISNAFYGEESEGYWTIKLIDGANLFPSGNLTNWKILISGHRNRGTLSLPYPVTQLLLGVTPSGSTKTPVFSFVASKTTSPIIRYEAAVGNTASDELVKDWTSIGTATSGRQLSGLTLTTGQTYYLKVRAVSAEGISSVQVKPWQAN